MSTPMTAKQLVAQLERWSVPYHLMPNWETYGRDGDTGKPFGPVFGSGIHHTGDDAPDDADRNVIRNGRTGLPGPLAQFGGNDNGVIDVHSIHRCNHFGGGDPRVLDAVKAESYKKYPPATHEHEGSPGAVDGNDGFYGLENYYSGTHKMTTKQYQSMILLQCCICEFHNWSSKSVIGHKEWSDWKSDPASCDMAVVRLDITENLKLGPPKLRNKPPVPSVHDNHVTRMKDHIRVAVREASLVPADRKLIQSVKDQLEIQLGRLPGN